MLIEDGKGRGYKAAVGPENKLDVCAIVRSIDLYCNQAEGDTYSLVLSETPTISGSCFCYLKNGAEKDLVISSVKVSVTGGNPLSVKPFSLCILSTISLAK